MASLEPGGLIGAYVLEERLGRGGFGDVWRARHRVLGRLATVKVPVDSGASRLEHLARAATTQGRLDHPHIQALLDVSLDPAAPFLVLEHVDGASLRRRLAEPDGEDGRAIDAAEACRHLAAVLDALAHAHARGIFHGDLKPENVLVSRDGIVKVTDFGLAADSDAPPPTGARNSAVSSAGGEEGRGRGGGGGGGCAGTWEYVAPERRAAGGARADARSDLYAAGVVLYELLTGGRRPAGRFKLPGELGARGVTPALDALVASLLAQEPADRPESADAARDALVEIAGAPAEAVAAATVPAEASSQPRKLALRYDNLPEELRAAIAHELATVVRFVRPARVRAFLRALGDVRCSVGGGAGAGSEAPNERETAGALCELFGRCSTRRLLEAIEHFIAHFRPDAPPRSRERRALESICDRITAAMRDAGVGYAVTGDGQTRRVEPTWTHDAVVARVPPLLRACGWDAELGLFELALGAYARGDFGAAARGAASALDAAIGTFARKAEAPTELAADPGFAAERLALSGFTSAAFPPAFATARAGASARRPGRADAELALGAAGSAIIYLVRRYREIVLAGGLCPWRRHFERADRESLLV